MFLLSAMVYPLHRLLIPPTGTIPPAPESATPPLGTSGQHQKPSPRTSPPLFLSAVIVLFAAVVPVWALAVWGSARFDWGLASGMSVGLLSACLSLKSASFARLWYRSYDDLAPPRRTQEAAGREVGALSAGENDDPTRKILTAEEFLFFLLAAPTLVRVIGAPWYRCASFRLPLL